MMPEMQVSEKEALQRENDELHRKLGAIHTLPEKWKRLNDKFSGRWSAHRCANELQAELEKFMPDCKHERFGNDRHCEECGKCATEIVKELGIECSKWAMSAYAMKREVEAQREALDLAEDGWRMANGTADLAMKHRNAAERKLAAVCIVVEEIPCTPFWRDRFDLTLKREY